ncbi:hypothetical protein Fmac_003088 [Flemingia macrophylla]|uniref:Uncharacterized protein n=1 Tax=Flemingia macrophylla TaxID=520843 RepID=A0ABD1NMJ4_9FABA
MIMVLIKNTACLAFVFLCAAWLATARLNPTGAAVNEIPDIKESPTTRVTKTGNVKSLAAIDEGNLNNANVKLLMSKSEKANVKSKRNNVGPLAFTADYHRPVHHPPKNNK